MKDDTKDALASWGLVLIALLAIGEARDRFGPIGFGIAVLLIGLIGRRVVFWIDEARRVRREEERNDHEA